MGDIARMERVGGQPAIDFVNTLGGRPDDPDDEYLLSYTDLVTFAGGSGLLDPRTIDRLRRAGERQPDRATEVLDRALQLRGCLDRLLRAEIEHQPPSRQDLDALRQAYIAALVHAAMQQVGDHYDWTWHSTSDVLDQPLWPIAHQAVELMRFAPLHRLTRCGHCRWLFLDTSKNRSRRWCSMNTCGSIMKMRRYRAARRP